MSDSNKVLIVDEMHPSIERLLTDAGFDPDYRPEISREELLSQIEDYTGLIIRSKTTVDGELLDKAAKLTFVARAGAGIDKIDYPELTRRGIKLINAPEGNRDALGEHTMGMLLSILHRIHSSSFEVKNGIWRREENRGWELMGKTVGIYGYGFMGSAFTQRLAGFDCRVIAYDKYKSGFTSSLVEEVELEQFFEEVEILSIHVPLTKETRQLFTLDYLKKFRKLKLILNTSRGEVLSLRAVNTLLDEDVLVGAGLDVLENEKLDKMTDSEKEEFQRLAEHNNVILTPHVAGWTYESYQKINEVMVSKIVTGGLAQVRG